MMRGRLQYLYKLTRTSCRRGALAGALGLLACPVLPAVAEPKYEQMEGLKGKDYGKVRTK